MSINMDLVNTFCNSIENGYDEKQKNIYTKIPRNIRDLFVKYSDIILGEKDMYSKESYKRALLIKQLEGSTCEIINYSEKSILVKGDTTQYKEEFKLLNGKWNGSLGGWIFSKKRLVDVEKVISNEISKENISIDTPSPKARKSTSSSRKSASQSKTPKKYKKEYQRATEPDEESALYVYYTSLYEENPESRLAITWLTEHGMLDGEERAELIRKYIKLAKKKKLIR